ncbi:Uncharacterized protein dnl_58760 [Desulfonema limicola]|uniref:Uncharacterized protein n=1 Tax=Desulfonema limicola TaxID=45656 RepID=A0A975BDQ6_9BACT|nr:Uncharacterized protein dnl_58760 [Desulfonema limicola]
MRIIQIMEITVQTILNQDIQDNSVYPWVSLKHEHTHQAQKT